MDMELIRLKSEFLALETLMVAVLKSMQRSMPQFAESLRTSAQAATEQYRELPVKAQSPEESDLLAAEFQEALNRLLQRVLIAP